MWTQSLFGQNLIPDVLRLILLCKRRYSMWFFNNLSLLLSLLKQRLVKIVLWNLLSTQQRQLSNCVKRYHSDMHLITYRLSINVHFTSWNNRSLNQICIAKPQVLNLNLMVWISISLNVVMLVVSFYGWRVWYLSSKNVDHHWCLVLIRLVNCLVKISLLILLNTNIAMLLTFFLFVRMIFVFFQPNYARLL